MIACFGVCVLTIWGCSFYLIWLQTTAFCCGYSCWFQFVVGYTTCLPSAYNKMIIGHVEKSDNFYLQVIWRFTLIIGALSCKTCWLKTMLPELEFWCLIWANISSYTAPLWIWILICDIKDIVGVFKKLRLLTRLKFE